MIALKSWTSSLKEIQTEELPESMQFWAKEPLVLKEKQGGGIEKGSKTWNSEKKKTLTYEGRREKLKGHGKQ